VCVCVRARVFVFGERCVCVRARALFSEKQKKSFRKIKDELIGVSVCGAGVS